MANHEENACAQLPRAEIIARANDRLRQSGYGGIILATRGVMSLPTFNAVELSAALAQYDGFDADSDPHGERDFGDLALFGAELLWKIDYYDMQLRHGSDDPADSRITRRVLAVMLTSEY